jgi:hypothetical protein
MRVLRTLGIVHNDGRRQIAVATHFINAFFDVYLQRTPASDLRTEWATRRLKSSIDGLAKPRFLVE